MAPTGKNYPLAGGDPGTDAFAVTPHDSTNFTTRARALWVNSAGDVVLVTPAGNAITFTVSVPGTLIPVTCDRVNATGTTGGISIVGIV